ncbi:hypothetical protein MPER_14594, partial [Moniliophthora perniciosa FA553]
ITCDRQRASSVLETTTLVLVTRMKLLNIIPPLFFAIAIGAASPPLEVEPLIVTGDPTNRIDFVFFSDGYLTSEKDKFLEDALNFAQDITTNHTFHS